MAAALRRDTHDVRVVVVLMHRYDCVGDVDEGCATLAPAQHQPIVPIASANGKRRNRVKQAASVEENVAASPSIYSAFPHGTSTKLSIPFVAQAECRADPAVKAARYHEETFSFYGNDAQCSEQVVEKNNVSVDKTEHRTIGEGFRLGEDISQDWRAKGVPLHLCNMPSPVQRRGFGNPRIIPKEDHFASRQPDPARNGILSVPKKRSASSAVYRAPDMIFHSATAVISRCQPKVRSIRRNNRCGINRKYHRLTYRYST